MTGNTKVWRAPLAGLASLAMLATMGVAAGTANAATTVDASATVKFTSPYSDTSDKKGVSYADVISAGTTSTHPLTKALLDSNSSTATFGGFKVNGKFVPLTGQVKEGDKIEFANYSAADGVQLHYVDEQGTDLGYVWVSARVDGSSTFVTINPGQTPYDYADGHKLDLTKADVNGKKDVDLTKTQTLEFAASAVSTGSKLNVKVSSEVVKTLKFTANPDTDKDGKGESLPGGSDIVYPGAKADGSNDADYSVDVNTDSHFDPQSVIDNAVIRSSDRYDIWKFVNDGNGQDFSAATDVNVDWTVNPVVMKAVKVEFVVNGKVVDSLTQYKAPGQKVTKPADPVATDGSVFQGWYLDANNNGEFDPEEQDAAKFDFDAAIDSTRTTITLFAGWANGGSHTVTYKFADDKTADKTETYLASQQTARPADPTRDGYIFDAWYVDGNDDGTLDTSEVNAGEYKFGDVLTANVTLIARWLKADDATLQAALSYIDGGDESFNHAYGDVFTKASFKEYVTTYQKVQREYADAHNKATAADTQIPAETFKSLLDELVAGWKKLEFVHTGDSTSQNFVHRLSNPKDHFYTQNQKEITHLTSPLLGGTWTDEGNLFQTVPFAEGATPIKDLPAKYKGHRFNTVQEVYGYLTSFDDIRSGNGGTAKPSADAIKTLKTVADPILTNVTRLYNRVNGDHVWTVDQNEADYLSAQDAWNNEGTAFYVPRYTGSQAVTRLAKGNRHLLSTDANEVKVLTADGWGNEGVAFKAY